MVVAAQCGTEFVASVLSQASFADARGISAGGGGGVVGGGGGVEGGGGGGGGDEEKEPRGQWARCEGAEE